MEVTFYKFGLRHDGFFVQKEIIDKVENMTKKQLMEIADLRHPVLTKKEFYDVLSTDKDGNRKNEFNLMTSTHYLIVKLKYT